MVTAAVAIFMVMNIIFAAHFLPSGSKLGDQNPMVRQKVPSPHSYVNRNSNVLNSDYRGDPEVEIKTVVAETPRSERDQAMIFKNPPVPVLETQAASTTERQLQGVDEGDKAVTETDAKRQKVVDSAPNTEQSLKARAAFFIKKGDRFFVTSRDNMDLHDSLPVGTYSIGVDFSGEYFLKTIDDFEVHGKIYGDTTKHADRILRTFLDRPGQSTGVLLAGEQGSGKTFLAKYIAVQAAKKHKISTVVVNQPLSGESFNTFIQSIQQPTIFFI